MICEYYIRRHSHLPQASEQCFHKTLNILPSFVLVIFLDRFLTIMIEIVLHPSIRFSFEMAGFIWFHQLFKRKAISLKFF